ncbi:MAG TPA: energy transducer TonB [Gemmatimonadales bacterium]|jgi:protein TonB
MYDDLARTQNPPPLEWFVVHAIIPSLVLTLIMHMPGGTDCELSLQPVPEGVSPRMRAFSSVASITAHVALGAAVFLGSTKTGQSDLVRPVERMMFFQPAPPVDEAGGLSLPGPVTVVPPEDLRFIRAPSTLPQTGAPQSFSPIYSGTVSTPGTSQLGGLGGLLTEEHAEVLTGPLPVYPDLLRQAGVRGRVVLEAVVDTTGRVLAQSISIVSATNPGFVAPARLALLATLFRPAMIGGKPVRMRVRIPYEFAIRNGHG